MTSSHSLHACYLLRRKASLNSLGRLWVGRVLFYLFAFDLETMLSALMTFEQRGTPALTGTLSFCGLILRTAPISCHLGLTRGTQNLSLLGSPLGQWAGCFYHMMCTSDLTRSRLADNQVNLSTYMCLTFYQL